MPLEQKNHILLNTDVVSLMHKNHVDLLRGWRLSRFQEFNKSCTGKEKMKPKEKKISHTGMLGNVPAVVSFINLRQFKLAIYAASSIALLCWSV